MTKYHRPPQTQFGVIAQPKAGQAVAGRPNPPASPPTRFGPASPVQAKTRPMPATVRVPPAPPPTRFGPAAPIQAKAGGARTAGPPAPSFPEAAGQGQPRHAQMPGGATVQMMRSSTRPKKPPPNLQDYIFEENEYEEEFKNTLSSMGDDRPLDVVTQVDGEDYAYYPPGSKEVWPFSRPGWDISVYATIKARQTQGGDLICALCGGAIALNSAGKEVWRSKSGHKHETRPPIDHDSPDWIERLRRIKSWAEDKFQKSLNSLTHSEKSEVRDVVVEHYHADTLQIAHMVCNSGKIKA